LKRADRVSVTRLRKIGCARMIKMGTQIETITTKARSIPSNNRQFLDLRLPGIDTNIGRGGFEGTVEGAPKY
jgi:hypothetical protein